MKFILKMLVGLLLLALLAASAGAYWYLHGKRPQREGTLDLSGLLAPVTVRYDERGIPHIKAKNETDLYRALGYVHAQDRLFQMEMVRRLARGELAEILGTPLLNVDKLFRTLGLRDRAAEMAQSLAPQSPATLALLAYLDGINQYQNTRPAPMEFDLLHISKRPFTPEDTLAVTGYLAYSFAAALKTEPVLTFVRDRLGEDYLRIFDLEWNPQGVLSKSTAMAQPNWSALAAVGQASQQAQELAHIALLEGSNAWVVSGERTSSGLPMLAGDPHIGFSLPAVWYEAHLNAPGFELYGHFQALSPFALLGHNLEFGWSLTMFQNDDMDLVAEKLNPQNPHQVWFDGRWVNMERTPHTIQVKNADPVTIFRERGAHGPIITSAFTDSLGDTPIALWWAFLETENPILEAFYALNRADTLIKARQAASLIHAPGLNVVWANAKGDIGWWAAAQLPVRPLGVNPSFILQADSPESEKLGFYRFSDNPHEENPDRGYILSANHQPLSSSGIPIPGYYNVQDRAQALEDRLSNDKLQWNMLNTQSLQLSTQTAYYWRVLGPLMPVLSEVVREPLERSVFDSLSLWDGQYTPLNIPPTVFTQFSYELVKAALRDELGEVQFKNLLGTRALDQAIPRLVADEDSPWWDNARTDKVETRLDIVRQAWRNTVKHLKESLGSSPNDWGWGAAHTLTHSHPLSAQKPLDWFLNAGPFPVAGGREVPNNMAYNLGPAPWPVSYGPSTRRIIDFADAGLARGINPVGQSGVWTDPYYSDQAAAYAVGGYMQMYLHEADVAANTRSTLSLKPALPGLASSPVPSVSTPAPGTH